MLARPFYLLNSQLHRLYRTPIHCNVVCIVGAKLYNPHLTLLPTPEPSTLSRWALNDISPLDNRLSEIHV